MRSTPLLRDVNGYIFEIIHLTDRATIKKEQAMATKDTKYVGLDVHKETIAVAMAEEGRGNPVFYGQIPSTPEALRRLVNQLSGAPSELSFCYEAGPCGYQVYRQLVSWGYDCVVVAPALIPRKAGERIKTDRRDALSLARLFRAGELTPVWVPDDEQEAIRDLVRCREDGKQQEQKARQRLNAFLLRHGQVYGRKTRWTQAHFRWLEGCRFDSPAQQIVFEEYVQTIRQATARVAALEAEMDRVWPTWSLAPVVEGLMALRGVSLITAMTVVAEIGDLTRFDSPRSLMAYLGLVPGEHSSGLRQQRRGITKTGNGHVRRVLVEAAWCYRFPARKTAHLQRRAERTPAAVQDIAWKAQKRLSHRYRHLQRQGKPKAQVCTAVARELAGFLWAIAWQVTDPTPAAVLIGGE
jgi:transposase